MGVQGRGIQITGRDGRRNLYYRDLGDESGSILSMPEEDLASAFPDEVNDFNRTLVSQSQGPNVATFSSRNPQTGEMAGKMYRGGESYNFGGIPEDLAREEQPADYHAFMRDYSMRETPDASVPVATRQGGRIVPEGAAGHPGMDLGTVLSMQSQGRLDVDPSVLYDASQPEEREPQANVEIGRVAMHRVPARPEVSVRTAAKGPGMREFQPIAPPGEDRAQVLAGGVQHPGLRALLQSAEGTLPDEDLSDAQDAARQRRGAAMIARAGSTFSNALTKRRPDAEAQKRIDAEADQPITDLAQQRAAAQAKNAARSQAIKTAEDERDLQDKSDEVDPASRRSVVARHMFKTYYGSEYPDIANAPDFENMSARDIRDAISGAQAKSTIDERAQNHKDLAEARKLQAEAIREQRMARLQDKADKDAERLERTDDLAIQKMNSGGAAKLISPTDALEQVDALVRKQQRKKGRPEDGIGDESGFDLEGVGGLDNWKPDFLKSDDGVALSKAAKTFAETVLRDFTGAAAPKGEHKENLDKLAMGKFNSDADFMTALRVARDFMASKMDAIEAAGLNDRQRKKFEAREGAMTAGRIRNIGKPSEEMVDVLDPNGRPRKVPRSKLKAALAAGGSLP